MLTPLEKIRVAHGHYVLGISQEKLAVLMVVNIGRVNEACKEVLAAVGGIPGPAGRVYGLSQEEVAALDIKLS